MPPSILSLEQTTLLSAARRISIENDIQAILLLVENILSFEEVKKLLERLKIVIAATDPAIGEAAKAAGLFFVLLRETETRQNQLTQAILEAIADEILATGDKVVALYSSFDREDLDTLSVLNLEDHLARLTSRDLQRIETQVPLTTLRMVVNLATDIGRDGRESKKVGTILVVGDHRKVLKLSHEGVHDPFRGYARKECELRDPRTRESIKELAQIDGAFVIAAEGYVVSAGRILDAPMHGLTLSKGLGARHWAAAAISKSTRAIAIAVSESTGTVRLFQDGEVVLRIEPMDRAMIWHEFETEPS